MMNLKPVQSSQINAIGYDPATQKMRIEFKPGSLYEYDNVPADLFEAFEKAPSTGSFFYKNIKPFKDKYPYVRLELLNDETQADQKYPANIDKGAPAPESTAAVSTDELVGDARGVMADAEESDQERLAETQPVEAHEQPGGGGL